VVVSLAVSPTLGIIAGGVAGPAIGLLVPAPSAGETAVLGTSASVGRYGLPGTRRDDRPSANGDR